MKISQDSKYLNLFSKGDQFQVFNIQTKQRLYRLELQKYSNRSISWIDITKDNKTILAFSSEDSTIRVWDSETKQELDCYHNFPEGDIQRLFLSSDNQYMILASKNVSIKVRRITLKMGGYELTAVPEKVCVLHVSILEDTGKIILALESGSVKMFDLNTKEEIDHFDLGMRLWAFALSSNSLAITFAVVTWKEIEQIKIFSFSKKKEEICFNSSKQYEFSCLKISKDDKFLAAILHGFGIKVFDFETKKEKWDLESSNGFYQLTISPDNKYLFCGNQEGSIYSYDLETGKLVYCFKEAHNSRIIGLFVSRNNQHIISEANDRSMKIFNGETKQEMKTSQIEASFSPISSMCSDNKIFTVKDMENNKFKVFDIHTMKELREFTFGQVFNGTVSAISKDKKTIIAGPSVFQTCLDELVYVSSKIPNTSIFAGYDDFITSSWPKDVETQKELLLYYRDMYIYPHNWTLLHLLAIFRPSAISQIPEYAQYPIDFLLDSYDKTPLHYLLAQKNQDYTVINKTFKYIIDYLEDKRAKVYECQRICSSLSQCFFFIISRTSPSVIQKYLKICYPETPLQHGQVLPSFGISGQKYTYSQLPVIDSQTFQKLYQEGDDRIIFRTNLIRLDYDPLSNDMFNTIHVLYENEQENIFKLPIIENLIDHLWESTKITMYITASAFSLLMITLSFYIASEEKSIYLEVSIIILVAVFIFFEAFQVIVLGIEYLRSVWNWIDIMQLLLTMVLIINKLITHQEILGEAWIVSVIVITGYLKWLSYLRLFTSTRILIEIILAVLLDMLGFVIIIAAILTGFSLIFLEFGRYQAVSQDYGIHFYNTFKLLFGNYDDTDYSLSQIILVSFLMCMLNVVLLNLLIAIIGDSYGKVQEGRDLIDAKTRLEMIQEAVIVMRNIRRKKTSEKEYLIYRLPDILEEKDLEDRRFEDRMGRIENSLKEQVEITKKTAMDLKEDMGEQVKIQNDTKKEIEIIKQSVNELKENLGEQVGTIQNEIQGLKELVNVLLTKTITPNPAKE